MVTLTQQTPKPKPTRLQTTSLIAVGILPYAAGLVVLTTTAVRWLVLVGVVVCFCSTMGAFRLRRTANPVAAKQWLIADPILFGSEFVLAAVLIHYVFARS